VTHKDYLKNDSDENYDFDSSRVGGNRYATILLYMSEVDSGGETVFEKAWPEGTTDEQKKRPLKETIHELRESGQIDLLEEGSWEEHLTALCRTRLVIRPKSGRAVLFYSQHPNGQVDEASLHGACPVLAGTKVSSTFHAIHSPCVWSWQSLTHCALIANFDASSGPPTFGFGVLLDQSSLARRNYGQTSRRRIRRRSLLSSPTQGKIRDLTMPSSFGIRKRPLASSGPMTRPLASTRSLVIAGMSWWMGFRSTSL
jgi:hypothetical protein